MTYAPERDEIRDIINKRIDRNRKKMPFRMSPRIIVEGLKRLIAGSSGASESADHLPYKR